MSVANLQTINHKSITNTNGQVVKSVPDSSFVGDTQTHTTTSTSASIDSGTVSVSDGDHISSSSLQYAISEFNKSRKLFITNIPIVNYEDVKRFTGVNTVKDITINKTTRQAVVTLSDGSEAEELASRLDGCRLQGTPVSVSLAPCYTLLCLTQLPFLDFDDEALRSLVTRYGEVQRCFLMRNSKGESKGYGFVEYASSLHLSRICQQLNDTTLPGRGPDSAAASALGCPDSTAAGALSEANNHDSKTANVSSSSTSISSASSSPIRHIIRCGIVPPGLTRFSQLHSQCLRVDNLPPNYKNIVELRSLLSRYGMPPYCQLATRNSQPLGFGVVEYTDARVAELTQTHIDGAVGLGGGATSGGPEGDGSPRLSLTYCVPGLKAIDIYGKMMASLDRPHVNKVNNSSAGDPSSVGGRATLLGNRGATANLTTPMMQNLLAQSPQALRSFQDILRALQHRVYVHQRSQRPGLLGFAPPNNGPAHSPLHNPNLQIAILAVMMATQLQQSQPGLSGSHMMQQSMLKNLAQNQVPVGGGTKTQTKKPSLLGNPMIAQASSMLQGLNSTPPSQSKSNTTTATDSMQSAAPSSNWQALLNNFGQQLLGSFQSNASPKGVGLLGSTPPLLNMSAVGGGGGFLAGLPAVMQKLVAETQAIPGRRLEAMAPPQSAGVGNAAGAGAIGFGANPVLALFLETQIRQQLANQQKMNQARQAQQQQQQQKQQQQQQQQKQTPHPPAPLALSVSPATAVPLTPANEDDSAGAVTRTGLLGKRPCVDQGTSGQMGRMAAGGKKPLLAAPQITRAAAQRDDRASRVAYSNAAYSSGVTNSGTYAYPESYSAAQYKSSSSTTDQQSTEASAATYAAYQNYYDNYDYSKAYSQSDYQQWQSMYGQDAAGTTDSTTKTPATSSAHDSSGYASSPDASQQSTSGAGYDSYNASYDSTYDSSYDYSTGQWSYGYAGQQNGEKSEWTATGYDDSNQGTAQQQQQLVDYYSQLNTAGSTARPAATTTSLQDTSNAAAAYMQQYQREYAEYVKQYAASVAQQHPAPPPPPGESTPTTADLLPDSTPVGAYPAVRLAGSTAVGQKRGTPHLLPSPEASPQGGYIGQHSQGIGGHYAETYAKRRRI